MLNFTEDMQKLIKYTINRTAVFTLASMMALTTTGCNNNSKQNNILNSGYVGMIDGEIRLLQSVEVDSSVFLDDFEHQHYVDLITSANFTDSKLCENESYLSKDITILGTLVNYLTEEELILSKNNGGELSIVHLTEIYARLRDEFEFNGVVEEKYEDRNKVANIPFDTLVEGIDAKDIFVVSEVNGKNEPIDYNFSIYIDNYMNETPGLFDLFDSSFKIFPCYRSSEQPSLEDRKQILSTLGGKRFTYPIQINEFLKEIGLSYFYKEEYTTQELEKLEILLNDREVIKYTSDKIFVFIPAEADVEVTENEYDEQLDKYYVVIQKEDIVFDAEFECASTDVHAWARLYELSDGETTGFQIHAKCGTLSFNGIASETSLIPINDFLASIGLEDYTKFEYSTGELIDINSYINISNKVLKK